MKRSVFLWLKLLILSSLINSCVTQFFKPSPWVKDADLSLLDGRYYSKSEIHKTEYRDYQNHFLLLFNEGENIENAHYIDLEFVEPSQLKISYLLQNGVEYKTKTVNLTMKKKKKYWEYYFRKEDIIIPLVYSYTDMDRVRIGLGKDKHLRVEKYRDKSGGILIMGGGFASNSENKFFRYEEYPYMRPFQENGRWGVVHKGSIIVPPKYELTNIFELNYIKIKENGKYGLLDEHGKMIIPPLYDDVIKTNNEYRLVFYVRKGNKMGMVNEEGREFIPPIYDDITTEYGYYLVGLNRKWGIANTSGVIFPAIYDRIETYESYNRNERNRYEFYKYFVGRKGEKDYILELNGFEYEASRNVPVFQMGQKIYPKIETKRKVSIDEQKEIIPAE